MVQAPYAAYAPPLVPWFVSRRPYCEVRHSANGPTPHGQRPSGGGAAGKTFRSALRVFNVAAEPMAQPMSCSPPPVNPAYGCCEFRYAANGWAGSRWRRAYTPAFGAKSRDAQPQWRPSKFDDGRHNDKSGSHHADDSGGASSAVDHGRTNTENFLPRIIKPRKRKKKDRKPSGADAPSSSTSSVSSSSSPQLPKKADDALVHQKSGDVGRLYVTRSLLEGLRSAAAVATAAALAADQHGFDSRLAMLKSLRDFDGDVATPSALGGADDAVALLAAMVDVDADDQEAEAVFCNCRYCDPQGVVWDVKEKRYSANLMRPGALSAGTAAPEEPAPTASAVVDVGQPKNLLVSSQIVTSLNGHRDIEIKFYSSSSEKS